MKNFYSPYINRFIQPDSIIPNPADPQSLNRFSYVQNNPIRYTDPSGHFSVQNEAGTSLDDKCADGVGGTMSCWIYPEKHPKAGHVIPRPKKDLPVASHEEPDYWDVANDLEICNGNRTCIESIMRLYYEDLGHPIDQLVAYPLKQSPLGANELYFMEPPILMEMNKNGNSRFLKTLNVDPAYPYNYEPVYLRALQNKYPRQYEFANDHSNWVFDSIPELFEYYFDASRYAWVIGER